MVNSVLEGFAQAVAEHPRRPAVFWGEETIRYRELAERINVAGAHLQQHAGIQPGDRVGILLKNCPEFIYVLYAILKSGGVAVPINHFLKAPEIQHIVSDCGLACLVTSPDFDETVASVTVPKLVRVGDLCGASPELPRWVQPRAADLAVIIYTSGTTGKSKGAMLTHGNFAANVASCITALEETPRDRMTLLLPMFHSFMLTVCIFTPLSMGAAIVLIKSVQPFKLALKEMIRRRATVFVGIPQIFQALAQAPIPFYVHWLLHIRVAVSGAAPLPHETLEAFARKFRFPLLEGYGLSEASPVVSFNPIRGVRKEGSVGLVLPGVEVNIVDDNDQEVSVGQVGEVVVRGPNVMQGYYNQPAETAAALRHGWLHTGDMGRMDEDGYLYIVDRRKEMFLVRGMNVYPREIEEVIYRLPNVREAAVVARPDEKRGEAAVAFVVPVAGQTLTPDAVLQLCRQNLADYKLPREVRIMSELPHTATGKIAKLELKKLL